MPRRNVNDEVRDASIGDRLKMGTDRFEGNALQQLSFRFQDVPSLDHEFLKAAAGFLLPQQFQVERGSVPGAVRSDQFLLC